MEPLLTVVADTRYICFILLYYNLRQFQHAVAAASAHLSPATPADHSGATNLPAWTNVFTFAFTTLAAHCAMIVSPVAVGQSWNVIFSLWVMSTLFHFVFIAQASALALLPMMTRWCALDPYRVLLD